MSVNPDLVVMGRIGMDLYPTQPGSFSEVTSFEHAVGGSAANVAIAATRLGCRTSLISAVGTDRVGDYLLGELARFGVDAAHVERSASLKTPIVLAELDPPDDPHLEFYREPSAPDLQIDAARLPRELIEQAQLLWVTGTGLSVEPSRAATISALRWRHDRNLDSVFDLDWRPMLWRHPEDAEQVFRQACAYAQIIVGNRTEVGVALGASPDDTMEWAAWAAGSLHDMGARLAIVKLGADGVLMSEQGGTPIVVPPVPVEVICGLGSGDAFGGSLAGSLIDRVDMLTAGQRANAAGALVASKLLCSAAMPDTQELTAFMERHA